MPKTDARLSLEIYKRFAKQTEHVVAYLNRARILEQELGITIPEARHAPLSLAKALEEYLNDTGPSSSSPAPRQQPTSSPSQQQSRKFFGFFLRVLIFFSPLIAKLIKKYFQT